MDSDKLLEFLIDFGLMATLERGQRKSVPVWIRQYGSSFLLSDTRPAVKADGNTIGGMIPPKLALQNGVIMEEHVEEIAAFLMESFGLSESQAEHVIKKVREEQSPSK